MRMAAAGEWQLDEVVIPINSEKCSAQSCLVACGQTVLAKNGFQ